LIDKDQKPVWNPSTLGNVLDQTVQRYFDPVRQASLPVMINQGSSCLTRFVSFFLQLDVKKEGAADFKPLEANSYQEYPHRKTALLSEAEILRIASRQVSFFLFVLVFMSK